MKDVPLFSSFGFCHCFVIRISSLESASLRSEQLDERPGALSFQAKHSGVEESLISRFIALSKPR